MNVKLIALAPIQDLSPDGLKMAVAERLTERGVDTERVELIIVNRPFFDFEEVLLKAFPKARLFSDPHTFIESVEYLALSPEWPVRRLLRWVFQANSFNEASARMRAFGEETAINRLEMAEWHCGWYGGDRVVNIYRLLDAGLWGGATPWDFRPHSNCVRLVKNLCGNPRDAKKTMGLLVASFKRKRHTYKEPTA